MKPKRHIIKEKYKEEIDAMYTEGNPMKDTFLHKDIT